MTKEENKQEKRFSMIDEKDLRNSRFERHGVKQLNLEDGIVTIGTHSQKDVRDYLNDYASKSSQEALLEISDILYVKSPHFRRLVQYFSDMATLAYSVIPKHGFSEEQRNSPDDIKEDYQGMMVFAKNMNIKHEYRKVMIEVFKSDIFYGYVHHTEDDFYIQKMPRELCAISSVEDGVFNYSIDMTKIDDNIDIYKYTMPKEVIDLYNEWLNEKDDSSNDSNQNDSGPVQKEEEMVSGDWKELSAENTIAIKFDESNHSLIIPPFASSFEAVYEIDGFKASRRNREQIDNYMMIFQKIPMRTDSESNNDFTIDFDSAGYFHSEIADSVPDSVGVVTTPMDLEPIEFKKDSVDIDNVAKSERGFWSSSGTSQALFSTENNTTQGIKASIRTDEQIVFALLRQLERWTTRFIKHKYGDSMFSVELLDITYFNQEDFYKKLLELSQYGVPIKTIIPNAMGIEPVQVDGLTYLENDILGIHESWIPMQSSHTMSGKDIEGRKSTDAEDGRPREDDEDVSDKTLENRK